MGWGLIPTPLELGSRQESGGGGVGENSGKLGAGAPSTGRRGRSASGLSGQSCQTDLWALARLDTAGPARPTLTLGSRESRLG